MQKRQKEKGGWRVRFGCTYDVIYIINDNLTLLILYMHMKFRW